VLVGNAVDFYHWRNGNPLYTDAFLLLRENAYAVEITA
jgi:hypothetical protein